MTRSIGRLNEVVQSLNVKTVSIYAIVNLQAAMKRVLGNGWVDPTLKRALGNISRNDFSPHVRGITLDMLTVIDEKGLADHANVVELPTRSH